MAKQQEVYKVAGVDETVPAVDPKKRKAEVEVSIFELLTRESFLTKL